VWLGHVIRSTYRSSALSTMPRNSRRSEYGFATLWICIFRRRVGRSNHLRFSHKDGHKNPEHGAFPGMN